MFIAILQSVYLLTYSKEEERANIEKYIYGELKFIGSDLQRTINFLLRKNFSHQVQEKIAKLGANSKVRYILLVDPNFNVIASTSQAHIKKNFWAVLKRQNETEIDTIKTSVDKVLHKPNSVLWTTTEYDAIFAIYPATFPTTSVLPEKNGGFVVIKHDLGEPVSKASGMYYRIAALQIVELIFIGIILHFMVSRRIELIVKSTQSIKQGKYDIHIPITESDELGKLARSIENMASQVSTSQKEQQQQKQHIQKLYDTARRSEETFAKAEAIAHIGSWDWDIVTGELRWSDEIFRIFGLKPQEFGATYDAFLNHIHPDDRQAVTDAVNIAVTDPEQPYNIEHRVVHSNDTVRIVQEQGKVYYDQSGKPNRMIGTVLDITDRKKAENKLQSALTMNENIVSSSPVGISIYNESGKCVVANDSIATIMGTTREQLLKQNYNSIEAWQSVGLTELAYLAIQKRMKTHGEFKMTTSQGQQVYCYCVFVPFRENLTQYLLLMVDDITERKISEEELAQHREKLEELVQIRTRALESAQDELIRKERLATLGHLTATVSHELRNPLGAMVPSLYIIKKLTSEADEKLQLAISRIERNISRCDRIIDELLDFTRISSIVLAENPLDQWLEEVISEQQIPTGVVVKTNYGLPDVQVAFDGDLLRRAVVNVVENACHAMLNSGTQKAMTGSQLIVSTNINEQRCEIKVEDNGTGMPTEIKEKIFVPLYSTKGFGVGLGMSTVKQIMEQHHGGIDIHSEENKGTLITLWLPSQQRMLNDDAA